MNISVPLHRLIKELGISQTDFAKKAKMSQPHLSKLLSADSSASPKTIRKIGERFGLYLSVESKFVVKNTINEFAARMIRDNQPYRAMHEYLSETFDCMIGMQDEFQEQEIDKEYLIRWMRFTLDLIENKEEEL